MRVENNRKPILIPALLGVAVGMFVGALFIFLAVKTYCGVCPHITLAEMLFPYSLILDPAVSHFWGAVLAGIQWPIYGAVISVALMSLSKKKFLFIICCLVILHVFSVREANLRVNALWAPKLNSKVFKREKSNLASHLPGARVSRAFIEDLSVSTLPAHAVNRGIIIPAFTQSHSQYGKFKAILIDRKGGKVSKASVTVEGVKGRQFSRKLVTNRSGEFVIDLPAGSYQITITKQGFGMLTITDVEIEANTRCTHQFLMPFATPPEINY